MSKNSSKNDQAESRAGSDDPGNGNDDELRNLGADIGSPDPLERERRAA